jgi:hypothetical protein
LIDSMASDRTDLNYRVVGIRRDGTRDERYWNLSLLTAEQVKTAMLISQEYQAVVVEDQGVRMRSIMRRGA